MSIDEKNILNEKDSSLISFGKFDLIFILNLEEKDLEEYHIDKQILEDLNDLSFLENNKEIWSKIELMSNDESLNALINLNKIKKTKNKINYLIFDEIKYNNINFDFNPILESILLWNGIEIKFFNICNCEINIQFKLKYKEEENTIILSGNANNNSENENTLSNGNDANTNDNKTNNNINDNKTNKSKDNDDSSSSNEDIDEKKDDFGDFNKLFEEDIQFEDFKYIFINVKDINLGHLGEFTLNQLYNFLVKIKYETNIEIILFLENTFNKSKDLFRIIEISDIHIFNNQNSFLEILKKKKIKDEKKYNKEKEILSKRIKTENNNYINKEKLEENNKNEYNSKDTDIFSSKPIIRSINKNKEEVNFLTLSQKKLKPLNVFINKSLNKNNMFNYLGNIILQKKKDNHPNYNNKLGIYFDEFNKIVFANITKNDYQTTVNEYNLNLFPNYNIYNMKIIGEIKNILKTNNSFCISILISCILGEIINCTEKINVNNYYSISLTSSYIIKIIIANKIKNVDISINKLLNLIKINKNDIKDIIDKQESEIKENGFNNNFGQNNIKNKSIYSPLRDKYLRSYMQSPTHIQVLRNNDFINTKKKILTKSMNSPRTIMDNEEIKEFIEFMNNKDINDRSQDYMKEFWKRKKESKYYIPGVNQEKEYYCYLGKGFKKKLLPAIKKKNKLNKKKYQVHVIEKNIINRAENENKNETTLKENNFEIGMNNSNQKDDKKDTSIYKEIKFNDTPLK